MRAQLDAIQTINSGFDVVCTLHQTKRLRKVLIIHSQIYRCNKLSTQFTNIAVKKSVSAGWLIGLNCFMWIIYKLGILEQIHPG